MADRDDLMYSSYSTHVDQGPSIPPSSSSIIHDSHPHPADHDHVCVPDATTPLISHDDEDARNEHVREPIPVFISLASLERRFGRGTRTYFDFHIAIMLSNVVLLILGLINYIKFVSVRGDVDSHMGLSVLFVSAYPPSLFRIWATTNWISVAVWFLFPILFILYLRRRPDVSDHDNPYLMASSDVIAENGKYTFHQRFLRCAAANIITLVAIGASAGIIILLQYIRLKVSFSVHQYSVMDFVVAGSVSVLNFMWNHVAHTLTHFEKHRTWAMARRNQTIKLWVFKIATVLILYVVAGHSLEDANICPLQDVGRKLFTLVLTDLLVNNVMEVLAPLIMFKFKTARGKHGQSSNDADRPEFDISEEYVIKLYRQFIAYIGMGPFPLLPLLVLLSNILEYVLDRYRMAKICRAPRRLEYSGRHFLAAYLFLTAIAGLVSYPVGAAYVLSGFYDASHKCAIFQEV